MSSRKALTLKLSPKARQDFIDILRYTGETWGQTQLLAYRDKINTALQTIRATPNLAACAMICRPHTGPTWLALTSSSTALAKTASRRRALLSAGRQTHLRAISRV